MIEKPVSDAWERLYGIVRKRLTGSLREIFEYFIQIQEFSPASAAKEFGIEPDAANQRASHIREIWRLVVEQVAESLSRRYEETRSLDAEYEWLSLCGSKSPNYSYDVTSPTILSVCIHLQPRPLFQYFLRRQNL